MKRPKHHSGEEEEKTLTLRQEQKFKSQEGEEAEAEEEDEEQQKVPHTCNKPFGCGRCSCDQCYPPGNALGRQR